MNKDVIYIDVEDDITAIIGKVKDTKEKIVALVPPKRVGVLQSAVNLRLLSRAAEQGDKRLVLITNNSALTALAATAKIPIAKNLQSKPEVPEIAALDVDNDEDVIDGTNLSIGELARSAEGASMAPGSGAINEAIRENAAEGITKATPPAPGVAPAKPRVKSGIRVPNFGSFRKKLILGIGSGVLLIAFLVWAIFFAPQATVIITARTTDSSANSKVTLGESLSTSLASNSIKAAVQQTKKDASIEFEATGSKEVGEKAQGQVVFRNCETMSPQSVPAGTVLSTGSKNFVTQTIATVPGGTGGFGGCSSPGVSSPIAVTAQEIGDTYNIAGNTTLNVAGHSSGSSTVYFKAVASADFTGGSKRQIKVVSSNDVQKTTDQLAQQNSDQEKNKLKKEFDDTFTVLDQTFKIDRGTPQVSPGLDQEVPAGAKPKLTASVTYSLSAVTKADVSKFLDEYFKKQLEGTKDQRVYENGLKNANFTDVNANDAGFTASLVATAKIGPKIDDAAIKQTAKGKRYGDIQSSIEAIQGVDDVDVKFWPFWVSSAPNDTNKIKIEFNLNEAK
jgi:hypothetical protein